MGILGSFSHQPEPASQDLQDQEEFLGRSPGSGGIPGDISGVRRREKEQIQGWVWRVSNPELCSSRCPILLPSAPSSSLLPPSQFFQKLEIPRWKSPGGHHPIPENPGSAGLELSRRLPRVLMSLKAKPKGVWREGGFGGWREPGWDSGIQGSTKTSGAAPGSSKFPLKREFWWWR